MCGCTSDRPANLALAVAVAVAAAGDNRDKPAAGDSSGTNPPLAGQSTAAVVALGPYPGARLWPSGVFLLACVLA